MCRKRFTRLNLIRMISLVVTFIFLCVASHVCAQEASKPQKTSVLDKESTTSLSFEQQQTIADIMAIRKRLGGGVARQMEGVLKGADSQSMFGKSLESEVLKQTPKSLPFSLSTSRSRQGQPLLGRAMSQAKTEQARMVDESQIVDPAAQSQRPSIPAGMVVIAIKDSGIRRLEGALRVGSRVNVVGERRTIAVAGVETVSETILQNVHVFSCPSEKSPKLVGLLVSKLASQQVVSAMKYATLKVVLCPGTETPELPLAETVRRVRLLAPPRSPKPPTTQSQVKRIRKVAREMDQLAADLEEIGVFEKADELRGMAHRLRLGVRGPNATCNDHSFGASASGQAPGRFR